MAAAIGFQLQERVTAIVRVCVRACDLSGQVTGIRVRGEDDWLQGDQTQTHTHRLWHKPLCTDTRIHTGEGHKDMHAGVCSSINHTHLSKM